MTKDKGAFLQTFQDFLDSFQVDGYGKCFFKLENGIACQGWLAEIDDSTFTFHDSGPLSSDEPHNLETADIDINTFAYWDDEINQWTEYFGPNKTENRLKVRVQH